MLHWGVSLYKYMCAVTMLQEGLSMMAETKYALQHIFQIVFLLVRFNRGSVFWNVQQKCWFLFLCFSQAYFPKYKESAICRQWWKATSLLIISTILTVLRYLYFTLLLLHYISEGNVILVAPLHLSDCYICYFVYSDIRSKTYDQFIE